MTWLLYLLASNALLCMCAVALAARYIATRKGLASSLRHERTAWHLVIKIRRERDQARSDLHFTTEVLSDVAAERRDLQDQVELLQARLRAQHLQRQAWRGGLN